MTPLGTYLASLYPDSELQRSEQPVQLRLPLARAAEPRRDEDAVRLEHHQQHQGVRPVSRDPADTESPRGTWWAPVDVALPTPNVDKELGRSYSTNLVSVLSPSMTNEAGRELHAPDARQLAGRIRALWRRGAGRRELQRIPVPLSDGSGAADATPPWVGRHGQVGNLWSAAPNVYAHNDSLQFSDKLTKLMGAHGLKFGLNVERGQKQQDFQNNESGQLQFDPGQYHRHGQLRGRHAGRATSVSSTRARRSSGKPLAGHAVRRVPVLGHRCLRAGQLEAPAELHAGIRRPLRQVDEQRGAEQPRGRLLHAESLYDPTQGLVPRPRHLQAAQRRLLRLQRLRARPACCRIATRSCSRASTPRGTSMARARTCSAAAMGCSTTGPWATSSTTTPCVCRPNAYASMPTSGTAAASATAPA